MQRTTSIRELINWVEDIKEKNHSSAASLYIIKDNKVLLDHYSGYHSYSKDAPQVSPKSQFNIASARKSYLGLALSYALYDGLISSLDDPVTKYFKHCDVELFKGTTIRHLATNSHGLDRKPDGTIYREFKAGKRWAYHNVGDGMIAELVNSLYNKGFPELLNERVFKPMGFTETGWRTKPHENLVKVIREVNEPPLSALGKLSDGTEKNLFVSTREFAKWGQLHLNRGVFNNIQIVPSEVIDYATTIHSPSYSNNSFPENGLFWYVQGKPRKRSEIGERVPQGSYQILGVTGPTILVIPQLNLVVSKMYNKRNNYGEGNYLHYLKEFGNKVVDVFS
ncbi:serine hydrolase domain-containing protein [Rossellomorea aquimaris]|uniref:serine hydrolase domain-containing protein n=1 Tax=Rossellomorea aquimaris TaxID=189382 RepID=UPI0007D067F6|nr:serine hydrolase domain-containing protein [Rossellomorea aquimaris]